MRRALLVVLGLLSSSSFAGVSIELRDASVLMVLQTVLRGVLNRDFVMASDVPVDKRVTVFVRDVDKDKALELCTEVLKADGVRVEEKAGVFFVSADRQPMPQQPGISGRGEALGVPVEDKPQPLPEKPEFVVYRPVHRTVAFLSQVVKLAGGSVGGASPAPVGFSSSPSSSAWPGGGGAPQPSPAQPVAAASDVLIYSVQEEDKAKVEKLLAEVDTPLPAVAVRAVLMEVSDGANSARSFSAALSLLAGRVGLAYNVGAAVTGGSVTWKAGGLDAVLSAVDGDNRFRLVSEPRVQVVSGETASFTVGTDVPVRGQMTLSRDGTPIQGIEYRSGGLLLNVTPQVFEGATIVKVEQQLSSFAMTTTSNIDSPTMLKRRVSSTVRASDDEVILMAGLNEESESEGHSGLSFLPRWLHSSSDNRSRSQLVLLLEVKRQKPAGI